MICIPNAAYPHAAANCCEHLFPLLLPMHRRLRQPAFSPTAHQATLACQSVHPNLCITMQKHRMDLEEMLQYASHELEPQVRASWELVPSSSVELVLPHKACCTACCPCHRRCALLLLLAVLSRLHCRG